MTEGAPGDERPARKQGLQRKTPLNRGTKGLSRGKQLDRGNGSLARGSGLQRRTPLRSEPVRSQDADSQRDGTFRRNGLAQGSSGLQRRTPLSPGAQPLSRKPTSDGKPRQGLGARQSTTDGTPPAGRARLPQQSKKRASEMPLRRKVVKTILAIQPVCVVPQCYARAVDVHERKTRGRGGSPTNPWNCVGLCRPHHEEITGEAKWAYPLGLLMHGWDPEPTEPAACLSPMQKAAVRRVVEDDWWPTTEYDVELWWQKTGGGRAA